MFSIQQLTQLDHQTFDLILFSLALTIILSGFIVWIYEFTSQKVTPPNDFLQSLILMSLITSMIMQSIGDSMARGFGIFGALAILRFRFNISNPRDVAFIFAAMGVGITCGVYSFMAGVFGTIGFCIIAVILKYTPFSKLSNLQGELRFKCAAPIRDIPAVTKIIQTASKKYSIQRYRVIKGEDDLVFMEYSCKILLKQDEDGLNLVKQLLDCGLVKDVRFVSNDITPQELP